MSYMAGFTLAIYFNQFKMGKGFGNPGDLDDVEAGKADHARLGEDVGMREYLLARAAEADALRFSSGSGGIAYAKDVPDALRTELFVFAGKVLYMMGSYTEEEIQAAQRDSDPKDEGDKEELRRMRARERSRFIKVVNAARTQLITALNGIGYDLVSFEGLGEMETRIYLNADTVDVRFLTEEETSGLPGGWVSIAQNVAAARNAALPQAAEDPIPPQGPDEVDDDPDYESD